ncbi:hypothetical protein QG37_02060 [Candidozyma auris]|uniref:Uncharacterized protein n=1 Tax=Candidozyma auris TaxID=498019 RepID=A0A0L0P471_CANAR|nr:hypothetical protein QG37_02060 [[Candida] auris]
MCQIGALAKCNVKQQVKRPEGVGKQNERNVVLDQGRKKFEKLKESEGSGG